MAPITGAPDRLYLLQLSTTSIPLPTGQSLAMSSGCYLVRTTDGKHILIDSGLPADYVAPPGTPPARNEQNVLQHLARLALSPEDIDLVICSHLDVDHAGYHDTFTHAEFIVQRKHLEVARNGSARYAGARAHWDHPAVRYCTVEGDIELCSGLWLIETSGHCPGHESVLVRLPQMGAVLLAIDAVAMGRLFTPERHAWPLDDDEEQLRASTRKLLDLVEREHVSLVIFGHDGTQWEGLIKAPDYYA